MTWLSSAFSSILTRCPKTERRRDLTMDENGGRLGHMMNVKISHKIMPTNAKDSPQTLLVPKYM